MMPNKNIIQTMAIPQLDGIPKPLPQASHNTSHEAYQYAEKPFQCETCYTTFGTEDQFNDRDRAHNFCCDESYLCFTTQVMADLHELEYHPNTHYADTYIPQSRKLIFDSGQSRNQPRT